MDKKQIFYAVLFINYCWVVCGREFMVVTVATEENDGLRRYLSSAKHFGYNVKVCGKGEKWRGGDLTLLPGGGQKISILKKCIEEYKDREDLYIMFTDAYDVVLQRTPDELMTVYDEMGGGVIFSAEDACWPDPDLAEKFPEVSMDERPFLCSGGYIGPARSIWALYTREEIADTDDDQLYFTHAFLDPELKTKHDMKLDTKVQIFLNVNGAMLNTDKEKAELELQFGEETLLYQKRFKTTPFVLHANGPTKVKFNAWANYLGGRWQNGECVECKQNRINLDEKEPSDWPTVTLAVIIEKPTVFIDRFFSRLKSLSYPANKIHLYIYNKEYAHFFQATDYVMWAESRFQSVTHIRPKEGLTAIQGRNKALAVAKELNTDYLLLLDSDTHIDDPHLLHKLISLNRPFITPMMGRPDMLWANFWGGLNEEGYYGRSFDYGDLRSQTRTGLWNVPYVNNIFLMTSEVVNEAQGMFYHEMFTEPDMALCANLRSKVRFMWMWNEEELGHLINSENVDPSTYVWEVYSIFDNPLEWEDMYIHENYTDSVKATLADIESPCPDVYWFPVVSVRFCEDLIRVMEHYNGWSSGSNQDERLDGGYENVPTRDVHMKQVFLEPQWKHFLKTYVKPLQQVVYQQYYQEGGPDAFMMFVVRYHPEEQDHLVPHHDASTYTINIALNRPGLDFTGGGCRFVRYNCSVTSPRQGWMFMHPGRLTHLHEGLKIKTGTRYIMVTFIDP